QKSLAASTAAGATRAGRRYNLHTGSATQHGVECTHKRGRPAVDDIFLVAHERVSHGAVNEGETKLGLNFNLVVVYDREMRDLSAPLCNEKIGTEPAGFEQ